jgi:hypothetical protein
MKGVLIGGRPVYEGSGFCEKTQISLRPEPRLHQVGVPCFARPASTDQPHMTKAE